MEKEMEKMSKHYLPGWSKLFCNWLSQQSKSDQLTIILACRTNKQQYISPGMYIIERFISYKYDITNK